MGMRLCDEVRVGVPVRRICKKAWAPSEDTFYKWLGRHESFAEMYARAKSTAMERMAENILDIADDGDLDHNDRRIRVDTRKWLMAKLAPRKYGDAQRIAHENTDGTPLVPVLNVTIGASPQQLLASDDE